ncbi:conserved hypothetical protein [Afipia carboxidovorans OM5]|uniref:Uncharacterized protein n=1 Tax=Afipia carboxidovorans (strain ATCC 49405 / DSM 1227 / KCTC 32145 / OM5) TaxID=504832 RepID=B6JEI9_AFIC5|nr:hypothetical protein [Afipia carboxidovorans]ACI93254.1 conserved hypothetical protein [Afipia carboxidovorans OM5]AEI03023.1 hypothetical protein OCA4_c18860 [Afipia carboxidovorans OM4]AEI06600.1 hypothetical protein OCA5_c18870 [Afipia carboxidovorans OM5]
MTIFGGFITGGTVSTDPGDATRLVFSGIVINGAGGAAAGDTFSAGGYQVPIASIDGTGAATLVYAFPVALDDVSAYAIARDSADRYNPAATNLLVRQYFSRVGDPGITYTVPDNADGPDEQIISDPQEGQKAIRYLPLPWTTWLYTEGAWVEQPGAPGGPGADGATWLVQDAEPTTDYPPNSLWLDTDSAGLDVYELSGSPLDWVSLGFGLKGEQGNPGTPGAPGDDGTDGLGVPAGGTTGQVLAKASDTDNDTQWIDPPAGGGDIAGDTHAASSKATPVDADEIPLVDSAASWGLKKLTWANLKATLASWLVSAGWIREALAANRTYYVRTDGSDSNNGLLNTSGGAFLTVQKAINTIVSKLDLAGYTVTIQLADGTYTNAFGFSAPWTGGGQIVIQGNATTPSNVLVSVTSANAVYNTGTLPGQLTVKDMKLQSTTSGVLLLNSGVGLIVFSNLVFGSAANSGHIVASGPAARITGSGNYSITGGGTTHNESVYGGLILINGVTVSISGNPTFGSAFAFSWRTGVIDIYGNTYSVTGSVTALRSSAIEGGGIVTGGQPASSYPPGNANGTTASNGWRT